LKRHPRSVELGLNIYEPVVNIYTDKAAYDAYLEYKKALGLVSFEPLSDPQRIAFDYAYAAPEVDFAKFLRNITQGMTVRKSYIAARAQPQKISQSLQKKQDNQKL